MRRYEFGRISAEQSGKKFKNLVFQGNTIKNAGGGGISWGGGGVHILGGTYPRGAHVLNARRGVLLSSRKLCFHIL